MTAAGIFSWYQLRLSVKNDYGHLISNPGFSHGPYFSFDLPARA